MRGFLKFSIIMFSILVAMQAGADTYKEPSTASFQASQTPSSVINILKNGNRRFYSDKSHQLHYLSHAKKTAGKQHPIAIILSCIDSRVPPEVVFNQPIGNLFVTRTAGNVIDKDIVGGMEFATKVAGSKLIVVMGHDSCGAVHGACAGVELGNLTHLLDKIQPAVSAASKKVGKKVCENPKFIDMISRTNVEDVAKQIKSQSPVIAKLIKDGKVKIIGAMYHLKNGKVTFFDVM